MMDYLLRHLAIFALFLFNAQASSVAKSPRQNCTFEPIDDEDYTFGYEQEQCRLTTLAGLDFTDVLKIPDRSIQYIDDRALGNLPRVKKVDFSGNVLLELPQEVFAGLENVREINLKSNHLIVADFRLFTGNPLLESVDLGHNKITKIQPHDGVNITSLRLNNNHIRTVSDLCRLAQLEHLDLSGNRHLQWTDFKFQCWPNMQTLILADANLKSMRNDYQTAFGGLTKLEMLNITNNSIVNVCTVNYPVLPKLVGLYMSHNKMQSLNITKLVEKFQNLSQIAIAGNAWSCEYFMNKLQTPILENNLTIMSDEAFCDMDRTGIPSDDDSITMCVIGGDDGPPHSVWFYVVIGAGVLVVCLIGLPLFVGRKRVHRKQKQIVDKADLTEKNNEKNEIEM